VNSMGLAPPKRRSSTESERPRCQATSCSVVPPRAGTGFSLEAALAVLEVHVLVAQPAAVSDKKVALLMREWVRAGPLWRERTKEIRAI